MQGVPAVAPSEVRAVCDLQMQTTPAAATEENIAATNCHIQAEDATEFVASTNVSQVAKVEKGRVGWSVG